MSSFSKFILLIVLVLATGCTQVPKQGGVVGQIDLRQGDVRPLVNGGSIPSVTAQITVNKDEIFNREFLYGADLQYSTAGDPGLNLTLQSIAIGHIPAFFRVSGSELQLVADNRRLWQSDVNHPEQLISRFKIISETAKTITVTQADSRVFLAEIWESQTNSISGSLINPKAAPAKDYWARSIQFDTKGDYLLQESTLQAADGNLAEFMEAIFPRDNLKPSPHFEKFEMDPENPVGADSGVIARFRFLPGEKIYHGEQAVTYAQHFDLDAGETIDWWVTPNIPDEDIVAVQAGVIGWNRYYKSMKGIERDVMRFRGRLPSGVKIGDPRYNVINWDSRLIAGAAYESQATDPESGKQSHSLIYLPAAWTQIGMNYWASGIYSDPQALKLPKIAQGSKRVLSCMRDMREAAALLASGRIAEIDTQAEIKEFGQHLLAGVIFHEVGHALGLNHNFKGSLSLDPAKPGSMFSTSIMDYNEYNIERASFTDLASASGPLLEYDRQALSALYNKQADILPANEVLPACSDEEADNEAGGIDPLCQRYDVEKDPTQSVSDAWSRINEADIAGDVTLTKAVAKVVKLNLSAKALAAIQTEDDFSGAAALVGASIRGALRYYVAGNPGSLGRAIRTNLHDLLVMAEGSLPQGYAEADMRDRVFSGLTRLIGMKDLPAGVNAAVVTATQDAVTQLKTSTFYTGLIAKDPTKATELAQAVSDALSKTLDIYRKDEARGLPAARIALLAEMIRHEEDPFFFGGETSAPVDFEASVVGLLADVVRDAADRSGTERMMAAAALMTYKNRLHGEKAINGLIPVIEAERAAAVKNAQREVAEKLLAVLKKK